MSVVQKRATPGTASNRIRRGGLTGLVALALLAALGAAPARAQNEPVRIFNRAGFAATALFVVRSGQSGWSGNLLNRGQLAPGEFLAVRLGEGGGCSFDLRMVLINGTEILRNDADVCATRSVDLAPPTPPPPPAAVPPTPQVGGADRFLPTIERAPRP